LRHLIRGGFTISTLCSIFLRRKINIMYKTEFLLTENLAEKYFGVISYLEFK
jgi:hypothetical protein